nr:hypothetical protein [Tanacetum cinerariifolium]
MSVWVAAICRQTRVNEENKRGLLFEGVEAKSKGKAPRLHVCLRIYEDEKGWAFTRNFKERDHDDKDKYEDPSAGSDRGLKKRKTRKDAEPPKGSKSKESMTSLSKGAKSQPKSSDKSVQAEEPMFETADTKMPQDQRGDTEDQPNVEATPMDDWFKKPNKPLTPDCAWNDGKYIDSRPPQKWISNIAKARYSRSLLKK